MELLRPFVSVNSIFYIFAVLGTGTLKFIENFAFLTCMLWPLCARLADGSGTDAWIKHGHQFFPFLKCSFCLPLASAKGTNILPEHAHQELMHTLSIHVRNCSVRWVYESGTGACTECSPFKTCWAYMCQELMRILSVRDRNWPELSVHTA